jgi:hypothetical protein
LSNCLGNAKIPTTEQLFDVWFDDNHDSRPEDLGAGVAPSFGPVLIDKGEFTQDDERRSCRENGHPARGGEKLMTKPNGGFMFIRYNPAEKIERLRTEFHENRARVGADENVPWEKRNAEVDRLWRDFDRQRQELLSAADTQGEATGEEAASPRHSFLPRRRLPSWK